MLYSDIEPAPQIGAHVGTSDIDLALDLVILDNERYEAVASSLTRAGFQPDANKDRNVTRQRWYSSNGARVEFLMPLVPPKTRSGAIQSLTTDLAAVMIRGLELALANRRIISVSGLDLEPRNVVRNVPVCPPDIFVVLKALAILGRDKKKHAYDIHYVLLHDPAGPRALGEGLIRYLPDDTIAEAIAGLRQNYRDVDDRGPKDVCAFLGVDDDALAGDAYAFMLQFLSRLP